MAIVVGCDFHSRFQLLTVYETAMQSRREVRLEHADRKEEVAFYEQLPADSLVLIESTGFTHWFLDLLASLRVPVKMGDAGRLAAMRPNVRRSSRFRVRGFGQDNPREQNSAT